MTGRAGGLGHGGRASARGGAALAALLAAALGGCALGQGFGRQPSPPTDEGEWAARRDAATRGGAVYDGFATIAFFKAVYLSPAVREARVARLAAWSALQPEERERLFEVERREAAQWDDFLVSVFTPDRADDDLDRPKSVWTVGLLVEGDGEARPAEIAILRVDPTMRALYPSVGDFDTIYRVRFARVRPPLSGRAFTLRMAGPRGRADLSFGGAP